MAAGFNMFGFLLKSRGEAEIRKLFQQYTVVINEQKLKMLDDITGWGDELIRSIMLHVNRQKHNLEADFSRRLNTLNRTCQQYVDDINAREKMNHTQEINQLIDKCKTLKFELDASLTTVRQTIPFIHVLSKQKSANKNPDGFDDAGTETDQIDNDSIDYNSGEEQNYPDIDPTIFPNLAYQGNRGKKRQSSSIESSCDVNRSTTRDNDMLEECPTCFMAFPSTMKRADRTKHINGHHTND